jgi:hypothetical protein
MRIASIAAASSIGLLLAHSTGAAGEGDNEALEQVVVTGTRVANRSALETTAPIDIVAGDQLQNLGITEINQALAAALPSFNFPRPGPDANPAPILNTTGTQSFNNYSPFGRSGRVVYGKVNYRF